ncbi:MAG: hypothetical protein JSS34_00365 [Proteobacteria bacterium]|nr:hypothetical protein [Pseudomonadota bacterium]
MKNLIITFVFGLISVSFFMSSSSIAGNDSSEKEYSRGTLGTNSMSEGESGGSR